MKIQINSLEALERLIGGDTEVEIEIRNSIVQEFTKSHLKAIATLPAIETVGNVLKREVIAEFLTSTKVGYSMVYGLIPEIIACIKTSINADIKKIISDELDKVLSTNTSIDELKKRLDQKVTDTETSLNSFAEKSRTRVIEAVVKIDGEITTKVLEGKIDKMVTDRIKAKFEL